MEILGGPIFAVAGAGESHGPGVTTIVFGCPAGTMISRSEIQQYLDRRRPGGNKHGTPRNEPDRVALLSGIYQENLTELLAGPGLSISAEHFNNQAATYDSGYATGEPIAALVISTSQKSEDYRQVSGAAGEVRPGHTDLVKFYQSGGFVDPRGGGRSSYRSTISDVIGGSIARACLRANFGTIFLSSICQVGPLKAKQSLSEMLASYDKPSQISNTELAKLETRLSDSEIHSIDSSFAEEAADLIIATRKQGDSLGAAIEVVAVNSPPLAGAPLYQSLKLRLMGSLGGLHAVQSCEVGAGMAAIGRTGSQYNDPIRSTGYAANNHGGMLGGITTGMPVVCRVGFKPTSTIAKPQKSVRKNMEEIDFELKTGRHDPCVGVRAGVTLESRMAIELLNAVLVQQAGKIDPTRFQLGPQ
jgi:chorismate synthase